MYVCVKYDDLLVVIYDDSENILLQETIDGWDDLKENSENFEEAVDALCGKVKTLIVTLGGQGCLYCKGGERIRIPCPKVRVVDTTAAGDTFCGALAARLSAGEDERAAVSYALAAASLAVTKQGAQRSIPYEREVREFLEKRS